jgi:cyclic pyranopterin phosphate synthase
MFQIGGGLMVKDVQIDERFTYINQQGRAKMVDVSEKKKAIREAIACGSIYMKKTTLEKIDSGEIIKGDVLSVAQVGGIMGAKKTADIIPMCHSVMMSGCDITFQLDYEKNKVDIIAIAKTIGETGIEMQALTAVSIAALTIYDMCKDVDKSMIISDIRLLRKIGGKSGEINNF